MSEFTAEDVRRILGEHFRRCDIIREAGGIALQDVVNRTKTVPTGWWLDDETYYYVPPGFTFGSARLQ